MLHQAESKILAALSGRMSAGEVAQKAGIPEGSVLSFAQSLKERGYITVSETVEDRWLPTPEGEKYLQGHFPEEHVFAAAGASQAVSGLSQEDRAVGLSWAVKNGWVKVADGNLQQNPNAQIGSYQPRLDLRAVKNGQEIPPEGRALLEKRRLVTKTSRKTVYLEPTAVKPDEAASEDEVNILTRDMLLSGSWKGKLFRGYDVSAPAEVPSPAKRHMVSRLRKRVSSIFVEMGFEEMRGPEVQSSFWNFDALFQPQDHPARDLADTFYLKGSAPLPKDDALVQRVRKIHEKYWGGQWGEENAAKAVLRTHTTAVSASYLYNFCRDKQPKKYFSIGKVFRNEATDYKHLAEFFQVEGIVVWEGATFRDLLGCLKEFYRKLGFEKIRFQPSYFPYTEPSLEVSVYFDKKGQWLELGGAGIFRPEVSIPLCDRYPVLAWGLSLERPLMLLDDMDDIRDFYKGNAGWLRKQKVQ